MSISIAGVITGDLVGSTEMEETLRRRCIEAIEQCFSVFGESAKGEIYRGDAFQIYTVEPASLVKMAIILRLSLLSLGQDARLSLSVAEATERELPVRISNNSEAFTLSGRNLDAMKSTRLAFSADSEPFTSDVKIVLSFLDDHLSQMTAKMARALLLWLDNPSKQHAELAENFGVSRSAFTRIINRANYVRIDETLRWYADRLIRYQRNGMFC
ncbi:MULTISPECIES: hypothetical protein [Grimontia]|uniref:Uncharacterized protein n=1 Tax=Grimontia marina TaxID=646534 RepID=A0A128F6P7_9GAMM|nr:MULTISPECIES: hypothetical protein [Grimontia]WRV98138.1 winged helix-turn-helix domain-containing protein [Grimontia sp. NTOU-MAR1]CZF82452.1 hypothetical protein GMA8713_02226 [Grimontia marina]